MTGPLDRRFRVVLRPLQAFLRLEAASGILLLLAASAALVWANLHPRSYEALFVAPHTFAAAGELVARFSLRALINDGLMTLFFFVVGMEVKRELVGGELNSPRKAVLPAVAAVGGMLVPIGIYVLFNWGRPGLRGWGIPMATDIAFCVGILVLLEDRVPRPLVVFVTALAIFDDIGGILVIALFYGHGFHVWWLLAALAPCLALLLMNQARVTSGLVFALVGIVLWYALHHGGIHATLAGVILGLGVPARSRRPSRQRLDELAEVQSPIGRLLHLLHPMVAFGIMPLFALANAGVPLRHVGLASFSSPVALGAAAGLFLGKQAGVFAFTLAAVRLGLSPMPAGSSTAKLLGVSTTAGVGFTVALFIAALAFEDEPALLDQAKLGILFGSVAAGLAGFLVLRLSRDPCARRK